MSTFNSTILTSVAGEDSQLITGAIGAAVVLTVTAIYYALSSKDKESNFPKLRGIQLYHAWNFFRRRYDFLQSNFKQNLGMSFSFKVLHHTVIVLTGEEARQAFFSNAHLDIRGYKILLGAVRVSLPRGPNVLLMLMFLGATNYRRGYSNRRERRREPRPLQQEAE